MSKVLRASITASNAARYLSMAASLDLRNASPNQWLEQGVESLTEAANALGYVLVRTRQPEATSETEAA